MLKNKFFSKYNTPILFSLLILNVITLTYFPIYIYNNGIVWQEPLIFIFGWLLSGLGITVGYHRYFSHKSFKTYPFMEWIFMFSGTMALQNKIIHWCSDHRRHHKKLDTNEDPYSIKEGFFHAHIGWILKNNPNKISGISDLEPKRSVKFQTKYYWPLAMVFCFIIPFLIGCLYGRPLGGLLWGGVVRVVLVHHFTFFIHSLRHFVGHRSYDIDTSARDSWYAAFFTFGEGYHNYHHKFQWDYRNGVKWYNFDPSKWIIRVLSYLRVTYNLRKAPKYSILKAQFETINQKFKKLSNKMKIDKNSYGKMNKIMNEAFEKLNSWKMLEKKYLKMKKYQVNKNQILFYQQKKKIFEIELKSSLSSLLIILVNLKKTI